PCGLVLKNKKKKNNFQKTPPGARGSHPPNAPPRLCGCVPTEIYPDKGGAAEILIILISIFPIFANVWIYLC
ncbi:hypothetical protein AB9B11_22630, partial [Enterobacter hormaechei]|uniref:hypothetical protein n=1 Tax=Enterobacter hormaechei TaxID=158836 RepID=UPI00350F3687